MKVTALFFAVFLTFVTQGRQLNFREIALPEAIRTSTLDLLHTDRRGFLWISSGPSIWLYDGSSFHQIHTDTTGNYGDEITSIFDDSRGIFWLGWKSGRLHTIEGDTAVIYDPEEGTPSVPVVKMTEDASGNFWMATYGEGLYVQTQDERWHNISVDDGLPSTDSYDLIPFKQGVMLATDQGAVYCSFDMGEKRIEILGSEDGLPDQIVKSLHKVKEKVYLGHYEPVVTRVSGAGAIDTTFKTPQGNTHMLLMSGKKLWWLSEGGDLFYQMGQADWQKVDLGDQRMRIRHISANTEGQLWISGNRGLYLLDQWLEKYPESGAVTALIASDSILWYSYDGDLFRRDLISGNVSRIWEGENLILSLFVDHYGRLWAGTFDTGVLLWKKGATDPLQLDESAGLINNNVLSIAGDEQYIWLGTLGGVSRYYLGTPELGAPQNFGRNSPLNIQYIYSIEIASDGSVYLATDGEGIMRWNGSSFEKMPIGNSRDVILDLCSDANGNIWWITPEGKVYYRNDSGELGELPVLKQEGGKPSGMTTTENGDLLIFNDGGMSRWNSNKLQWIDYGRAYGLGNLQPQLHAYYFGKNNVLYLGIADGILALHMDQLPKYPLPETYITAMELFQRKVRDTVFAADENYISFSYIGRWYTNPAQVRYKLRLMGYDRDWTISQNTHTTYPRLAPGNYEFSVVAGIDGYFPEDEIQSIRFTIHKPWYQRWYVWLPATLLLAVLIYYLLHQRVQRLKQKQLQEKERMKAQYEALKSQVNPHFLFNSFNTLLALIEENSTEAAKYLNSLSDFFRYILQFRNVDLINLNEELEIVKTYLKLQEQRFGENLKVEILIDEIALNSLIPPLTLQLLVENTFKHNTVSRKKPLHIRIFNDQKSLMVWNVLQEKAQRDISTGYGLESIGKKYTYYTDEAIEIDKTDEFFQVKLPLIKNPAP